MWACRQTGGGSAGETAGAESDPLHLPPLVQLALRPARPPPGTGPAASCLPELFSNALGVSWAGGARTGPPTLHWACVVTSGHHRAENCPLRWRQGPVWARAEPAAWAHLCMTTRHLPTLPAPTPLHCLGHLRLSVPSRGCLASEPSPQQTSAPRLAARLAGGARLGTSGTQDVRCVCCSLTSLGDPTVARLSSWRPSVGAARGPCWPGRRH